MAPATQRIASVDVVRTLAIAGVIAIHTTPFENPLQPIGRAFDPATVLNQAVRFAVPFFFIVAGYFWAATVAKEGQVLAPAWRTIKRIAIVWLAWCAVYLLPVNLVDALAHGAAGPFKVVYWNVAKALDKPVLTLLEGTRHHLWFLVAMMLSVALSACFLHPGRGDASRETKALLALSALAVLLYVVGLAGMAYANAPFGFRLPADVRNGHLYAPAFFVTGCWLRRRGPAARWAPLGMLLAAVGLAMHLGEVALIHRLWGGPLEHDYVAGTYLLGLGVALVALSGTPLLGWRRAAAIGPWVLGIYAAHLVFVEMLQPLERRFAGHWLWDLTCFAVVFALSYGLARLLGRHAKTRPLVS